MSRMLERPVQSKTIRSKPRLQRQTGDHSLDYARAEARSPFDPCSSPPTSHTSTDQRTCSPPTSHTSTDQRTCSAPTSHTSTDQRTCCPPTSHTSTDQRTCSARMHTRSQSGGLCHICAGPSKTRAPSCSFRARHIVPPMSLGRTHAGYLR